MLKENDEAGWKRAVEIDRALRASGSRCNSGMEGEMYLHRSCKPLEVIDFDREVSRRFCADRSGGDCEGMCGV